MGMHGAFGLAGRPRGIEPEGNLVGMGLCTMGQGAGRIERLDGDIRPAGCSRMGEPRNNDRVWLDRRLVDCLGKRGTQRRGDQCSPRLAVRQHVGIVVGRQERVDGHRHNARIEAAQEAHGPVVVVVHQQQDTVFASQPAREKALRDPPHTIFELPIAQASPVIDEGELFGSVRVDRKEMLRKVKCGARGRDFRTLGRICRECLCCQGVCVLHGLVSLSPVPGAVLALSGFYVLVNEKI